MSISDLYSSGQHKRDLGHFASIVKIAKADNEITDSEQQLLDKLARRLNIEEEEYKAILKTPENYPVNSPASYDDRIERLYRLAKMVLADSQVTMQEVVLMRKIAVGLRFSVDNAEKVCDEAIHLVINDNDLDAFTVAIKKVDKA